jgi:hypothetical protein
MKICYNIEHSLAVDGRQWFVLSYHIIDPSHSTGPPLGEIKTTFSKGDLIDIAFPVGDLDNPVYSDVYALIGVEPPRGWMVTNYFDDSGIDFGPAYRVIYEVMFDGIEFKPEKLKIMFVYNGKGNPGSQPWGFTAANDPGQHTELGETFKCTRLSPPKGLHIAE